MIESPWLIQTGWSRSRPANRPSSSVIVTVGRTVFAASRRQHVAAELVGHQLRAVADAEHRESGPLQIAGIGPRRALVVDGVRAAGEDDRLGAARSISAYGVSCGRSSE